MIDKIRKYLFFTVYYILAVVAYVVALPYLFYLSFKPKYKDSIPARFFLYKNSFFNEGEVWFHACSLGEVKSLKPLAEIYKNRCDISVITNTGYEEAKRIVKSVRYLPFEIWQSSWQKKRKVLVVLEAELWYMLFFVAKVKGAKTILLNARISDNSYRSYKRFAFFYKMIFENIDEVFAQTKRDADRLKELGAKDIKVIGNIKNSIRYEIKNRYKKPQNRRVILLASTHENEEKILLENMDLKLKDMIIVVPRHPERFKKVDKFLESWSVTNDKSYKKLSEDKSLDRDVILCDKMGDLIELYAISDVVLLGGSFLKGIGGHNPLEPAYFNNVIISGKHYFNQEALYKEVENIYISDLNEVNVLLHRDDLKKAYIKNVIDLAPVIKSIDDVV